MTSKILVASIALIVVGAGLTLYSDPVFLTALGVRHAVGFTSTGTTGTRGFNFTGTFPSNFTSGFPFNTTRTSTGSGGTLLSGTASDSNLTLLGVAVLGAGIILEVFSAVLWPKAKSQQPASPQ
ncbi:MAG: hypothetical protein JRN08_07115 [Nitrososphaerota archaeon]|nr:hypothetical protein [Nitrososphaerota archaeon]